MVKLDISVVSVADEPRSATPTLTLELEIVSSVPLQSLTLNCQIVLEARQREGYSVQEEPLLRDLFGERTRWHTTLKSLLWAQVPLSVAGFERVTRVPLLVPCSFDMTVAATKYLYALEEGSVPVTVMFSGMGFYHGSAGLQIAPVPSTQEARAVLSVALWRAVVERHYPDEVWVGMSRSCFARLYAYKVASGAASWDELCSRLLPS